MLKRLREHPMHRPSQFAAMVQGIPRDVLHFGPFCDGCGYAPMGDLNGAAPISLLFLPWNPMNVPGLVVSVIVDTINAIARAWLGADIFQKSRKTVPPFSTYANTATAPVAVGAMPSVITSLFHRYPGHMFGCLAQAMAWAATPASAGDGQSSDYGDSADCLGTAAVASKQPSRSILAWTGLTDHDESAESLAPFKSYEESGHGS